MEKTPSSYCTTICTQCVPIFFKYPVSLKIMPSRVLKKPSLVVASTNKMASKRSRYVGAGTPQISEFFRTVSDM